MIKITCPKCGEEIAIDRSQYDSLLNEIKTEEVEKEVQKRVQDEVSKVQIKNIHEMALETQKHKNEVDRLNLEKKQLEEKVKETESVIKAKVIEATQSIKDELVLKEQNIITLNSKLVEKEKEFIQKEQTLKETNRLALESKDKEIEYYKNFRMGDSTKDLGESLEKFCEDSFNEIRSVSYPEAYFEKDNEVIEGTKADYIFRDFRDGVEYISIIFDMKNQKDDTEHKHKNEDFFKKLDKDREKKGCEYAVLVSTLEEDSKLYNSGIVDVSHKYPKMFVVRPQQFLAIIGLLRNAALNNLGFKKEIALYRQENIDITKFEDAVKQIADKITTDYENAGKIYNNVEKMCEDMIKKINDFRESFRKATGHFEKAVNQLPNLEVRKLTRGNPTMKEKFEAIEKMNK